MRPCSGVPLLTANARLASATISMGPVMATTHPALAAKSRAKAAARRAASTSVTASSGFTSTPWVAAAAPAIAFTSLMLPRTSVTGSVSRSSHAVLVRSAEAPAPTGSSTIAWPRLAARAPATFMPSMLRAFSVPMLSTNASQMEVMSSTSAGSSLMMGLPPTASTAFAQPSTVT